MANQLAGALAHADCAYSAYSTLAFDSTDSVSGILEIAPMRVDVWSIEEKQTDVNMALHLYRDAARHSADCFVVCSNDSDVEPAMALVRQDFPRLQLGLVVHLLAQAEPHRFANKRLTRQAHWVRHTIREEELERSQLNEVIPTPRKAARKPAHW